MELVRSSPLELACGFMLGEDPSPPPVWDTRFPGPPSPRLALEAAVLPALRRPPCVVSFSGGRDSSLVLAVAVHVARREGLPLPIARTRRFGSDEASDESGWQEVVIRHLGIDEWDVVDCATTMGVLGDVARPFLSGHGVAFPAPLYVLADSIASAHGGSHLTGEGGDEVLAVRNAFYHRILVANSRALLRRVVRDRRALREVAGALGPEVLRRRLLTPTSTAEVPGSAWLRPGPLAELARSSARTAASEPADWRRSLRWLAVQRMQRTYLHNEAVVAAEHDVVATDPLMDWGFMQAMARAGGRYGFASRTAAMGYVGGDLLPAEVVGREGKAVFNVAYFTATERAFVDGWDGTGVDPEIVDPERLHAEWSTPVPAANSFMLLQAAWLASQGGSAQDGSARGLGSRGGAQTTSGPWADGPTAVG